MYTLTLTRSERAAFDWVGYRYANGDDTGNILREYLPDDIEWEDKVDITFSIPEYAAWDIQRYAEMEDYLWPCFAPELAAKMQAFCNNIV